jgi:hypothetical protein
MAGHADACVHLAHAVGAPRVRSLGCACGCCAGAEALLERLAPHTRAVQQRTLLFTRRSHPPRVLPLLLVRARAIVRGAHGYQPRTRLNRPRPLHSSASSLSLTAVMPYTAGLPERCSPHAGSPPRSRESSAPAGSWDGTFTTCGAMDTPGSDCACCGQLLGFGGGVHLNGSSRTGTAAAAPPSARRNA